MLSLISFLSISLPYDGYGLLISKMSPYIVFTMGGISLRWDFDSSSVYIILLSDSYAGSTKGLCGNYNGHAWDDFVSKSGETTNTVQ